MNSKTPVARLNELTQHLQKLSPVYTMETCFKDALIFFQCTVIVDGLTATGVGSTKQQAKHNSASNLLIYFNIKKDQPSTTSSVAPSVVNYVGRLNEHASKSRITQPNYSEDGFSNGEFIIKCIFNGFKSVGSGATKKIAKQCSARNMIQFLEQNKNKDTKNVSEVQGSVKVDIKLEKADVVGIHLNNEDLLKRFTQLSLNLEHDDKKGNICNVTSVATTEIENVQSKSEIDNLFQRLGSTYSVEIISSNPTVLLVKDKKTTLSSLEMGDDYDAVLLKALKKLLNIIITMNTSAEKI